VPKAKKRKGWRKKMKKEMRDKKRKKKSWMEIETRKKRIRVGVKNWGTPDIFGPFRQRSDIFGPLFFRLISTS
jgi:hypothetical protein